jgi:replicative DNA helicase
MMAQPAQAEQIAYPPSLINVEAEAGLIGALLCDARIVDSVADTLSADDFHEQLFGTMFSVIVREQSMGRALNPVTLRPFFEDVAAFHEVGGFNWLAELTSHSTNLVGARGFATQIIELSQRRRLVDGLRETLDNAATLDTPLEMVAGEAEEAIAAAMNDRSIENHERTAGAAVKAVIDSFDAPLTGVTCGHIPAIDRLLGPIRPTHFDVGAGRPGMGKTAFAVSYSLGAAKRGHGVLFFSLEMGSDELAERMIADECLDHRIPYEVIRDRTLDMIQRREVCRAQARINDLPIQIIDKAGLTIGQIRSMVRRWRRRFAARGQKLDLVIIDYLQLVRGDRRMDRIEVVSEVSRALKEIAKDEHLGVLALSQLSRKVEERADKRPQLSDLRESGQIEQDADAVIFFLRPEYYLRKEGEPVFGDPKHAEWHSKLEKCEGRIEFICAKRRGGREGSAWGEFLGTYQAVR